MDILALLEAINKALVIESGKKILNNAIADSHSDEYKIAIWWFHLKTRTFEFSMDAEGHNDHRYFSQTDRNDLAWVRGRVFESSENGRFYIAIYKESFKQGPLSGILLNRLYKLIQDSLPESIVVSGIVDEEGRDLLESKNQKGEPT